MTSLKDDERALAKAGLALAGMYHNVGWFNWHTWVKGRKVVKSWHLKRGWKQAAGGRLVPCTYGSIGAGGKRVGSLQPAKSS